MNMKTHILTLALAALCGMGLEQPSSFAQSRPSVPQQRTWNLGEIYVRDPFVLTEQESGTYYLYRSASTQWDEKQVLGGVEVFKSKDLKTWEGPQRVFTVPRDNWITGQVWAPEVHKYNGRYYLFATLNSEIVWKKFDPAKGAAHTFRGTQVFHSDSPEGPFEPFSLTPHTPMDYMALDGTLWVEDGTPYMVYCHEWVQIGDGAMNLVELESDLSAPKGRDIRLFNASAAPWSTGPETFVTDGCFLYKTKTGKLLMIWSSFKDGSYAVGIAESVTGKVAGPWRQQEEPIFTKDGGHAMIFKDLGGRLCISLHSPNSGDGRERAHFFELKDTGTTLVLGREISL